MNAILNSLAPDAQEKDRKFRLLVPVDFSKSCLRAVATSLRVARRFGADLTFVHVVQHLPHGSHPVLELVGIDQDWLKPARARLATFLAERLPAKFAHRETVLSGRPFLEICKFAETDRFDAIVVATHGYSGLAHLAMGSTAERIVRHARCPVLVVPVRPRRAGDIGLGRTVKRVLLPTDFSEPSRRWMKLGGAVAQEFGARALLTNILTPLDFPGLMVPPSILAEMSPENTRQHLCRFWAGEQSGEASMETIVLDGDPSEMICEAAERHHADLILMAAHGKSNWKKSLLGSTAEKVVRHASCPVLIVRESTPPQCMSQSR